MSPARSRPVACSQAEFARLQGWSPAYVVKLKKAGRLVLLSDGSVAVNASLDRIANTANGGAGGGESAADRSSEPFAQSAKDRQAHYAAELARLDYEERLNNLLDAGEVLAAVTHSATVFRSTLAAWPEIHAAQIAALGSDEAAIRAYLTSRVDEALQALGASLNAIVPEVAPARLAREAIDDAALGAGDTSRELTQNNDRGGAA